MPEHSRFPAWLPFSSPSYSRQDKATVAAAMAPCHSPDFYAGNLEREVATWLGVPPEWVLATNSCTAALTIAYHFATKTVAERGGNAMVECPVITWPSSYACAPAYRLVDCGLSGYGRDSHFSINWGPGSHIRTYVELYGRILRAHDLLEKAEWRIIDAAQNFLASTHGPALRAGHVDAICYSMGPIKQISAIRGGILVSPHMTSDWRAFADSGTLGRSAVYGCGFNLKIGEPNAALASSQLKRHKERQAHRAAIMKCYADRLQLSHELMTYGASGHLAILRIDCPIRFARIKGALLGRKIAVGHHYPLPSHCPTVQFPEARELSAQVMTIPCHTEMEPEDATLIAEIINAV